MAEMNLSAMKSLSIEDEKGEEEPNETKNPRRAARKLRMEAEDR